MHVCFYASDKPRERVTATAFCGGVVANGDTAEIRVDELDASVVHADCAVVIGVKGRSRPRMDAYLAAGRRVVYIDKGYFRVAARQYCKVSLDAFQPLAYFMSPARPDDRLKILQQQYHRNGHLNPAQWRMNGKIILLLGPSQKYCNFHGLGDATEYCRGVIDEIGRHSDRPTVYRPKASWADAVPIAGARYSRLPESQEELLARAWCLVTHGSNSSAEAIMRGVPVVALGPAIARPIVETKIESVDTPLIPTNNERQQWLQNLAYCQWTRDEMAAGSCWKHLKEIMNDHH